MNLSSAIMLVEPAVRAARVEYDPDNWKNNTTTRAFKTTDTTLVKGDYVVVPTHTRHGYTVVKIIEIDMIVDFEDHALKWDWIVGRVDEAAYERLTALEKTVTDKVAKAQENKHRKELQEAMALGQVDFSAFDVVNAGRAQIMAPSGSTSEGQGGKAPAVEPTTEPPEAPPSA